jgi:hypothetical protein
MTDLIDELRAECLSHCGLPPRPDGPTVEELAVLDRDLRWRAAIEIGPAPLPGCRRLAADGTARRTLARPAFCPGLAGRCPGDRRRRLALDANRRPLGYWVSDVGHLDKGHCRKRPWIEYPELQPRYWAPLTPPG